MLELDYVKIADALATIKNICDSFDDCVGCPFHINCSEVGMAFHTCEIGVRVPKQWNKIIERVLK